MTPIETTWRGYRFRSRTEARWAVMFTAAKEPFEYEKEGFALPSGWYLPDFWLPERSLWIEVKGQEPTQREIDLASELNAESGKWVLFAVGAPDPDRFEYLIASEGALLSSTTIYWPDFAIEESRSERFDGSHPRSPSSPNRRLPRWY